MQSTFPSQSDHASLTCGLLPHNSLEISSLDVERDTPVEEWSGRVTPVEEFLIGEGLRKSMHPFFANLYRVPSISHLDAPTLAFMSKVNYFITNDTFRVSLGDGISYLYITNACLTFEPGQIIQTRDLGRGAVIAFGGYVGCYRKVIVGFKKRGELGIRVVHYVVEAEKTKMGAYGKLRTWLTKNLPLSTDQYKISSRGRI
ncbi:hypothetical protein VKT23_017720 [Stygiomarasmius scandens]|uniref:Uncharacterized protein n=1 Tax=Marasmiellus scandens TaxID=2682957 RepID=A0ABR1IV70_9AGAR